MKRFYFGFFIGGILGAALGFLVAVFAYPFIFLADIEAAESLPDAAARQIVARGQFMHADPSDPLHHGKGSVTVYDDTLFLGADFEVGPGPKFHVYLVPLDGVTPDTPVAETMFVDLGRLRAFKGSQVFALPAGLDPAGFGSVVIWCEQFGVLISPATLEFQAGTTG